MAMQVQFPTKKPVIEPPKKSKSFGSKIGQALGAVAGGIVGGAAAAGTGGAGAPLIAKGAILGAGAGASLGGVAGELISPSTPGQAGQVVRQGTASPVPQQQGAVGRRLSLAEESPLQSIQGALESLPRFSPQVQREYLPPLLEAYSMQKLNPQEVA